MYQIANEGEGIRIHFHSGYSLCLLPFTDFVPLGRIALFDSEPSRVKKNLLVFVSNQNYDSHADSCRNFVSSDVDGRAMTTFVVRVRGILKQ